MKKYTLFGFLLIFLVIGCRKSLDETSIVITPQNPILIDNYTPTVENVVSTVIGTFVQVKKDGFFLGGRRFYPIENKTNLVRVDLIEKIFNQNFESNNGGEINIPGYDPLGTPEDGGEVIFQPNSIQDAGGNIYNGTIHVAANWLNPTNLKTYDRMPGALEGVNTSNEEIGLTSYGMIGVELQGDNGESLNIAEGFTAELNIKVPASLLSSAPTEIPLWSFNYTYGIWVEEGSALLQNGLYVGEVSHFSFWNCNIPSEVVHFDATILEENTESPISNVMVKISFSNGASSAVAYSNPEGIVSGFIPKNEILLLEIFSTCGNIIHSENIGSSATDISFGEIQITTSEITTITGEILDCDGALVNEGIVVLKYDNQYVTHFVEANPFSFTTTLCNNASQMEVIGGDAVTQQQGDPRIIPISNTINVGSLAACGQALIGTCKITINGTSRYFFIQSTTQQPDTITPYLTELDMFNQPNVPVGETLICEITINNTTGEFPFPTGDYSIYNGVTVLIDTQNGWQFTDNVSTGEGFTNFIVEECGPTTGTIISGYMSGILINSASGQDVPTFVEGEFTAIRSQ